MKVYISCDIEGTAALCDWNATVLGNGEHAAAALEMTKETLACIEGCHAAGATEIYVKDAHDSGRNLIFDMFPEDVHVLYGWAGHPDSMVAGLDESFDALLYLGWHAPAGTVGNPLAHTMDNRAYRHISLNGHFLSEFEMHALFAAGYGVPSVFLSGDDCMCRLAQGFVPKLATAAVKEGLGGMSIGLSSPSACALIQKQARAALAPEHIGQCLMPVPEHFCLDICYTLFKDAYRKSFYPNAKLLADKFTVRYETDRLEDFKIALRFLLV